MTDDILFTYDLETEFPTVWQESSYAIDQDELDESQIDGATYSRDKTPLNAARGMPRDEKDPLGIYPSIMQALQEQGILLSSGDSKEKAAKYMLSSTKFNPKAFLQNVHKNTSYEMLKASISYLRKQIAEQSNSGGSLLDDDHEKFVNAKRRLDSVMTQLKKSGITDNLGPINNLSKGVDESIKTVTMLTRPLEQLSTERSRLQTALALATDLHYLFDLPRLLKQHMISDEHDEFVRARRRGMAELSDIIVGCPPEVAIVGKRLQQPIDDVVNNYRQLLWKKLSESSYENDYGSLLGKLTDLEVSKNPAFEWMMCQANKFRNEIQRFFDEMKHETLLVCAENAVDTSREPTDLMKYIRHLEDGQVELDSAENLRIWNHIIGEMSDFSQLVDNACLFWRECSQLLSGRKLENCPKLTSSERDKVQEQFMGLIILMREQLKEWLASPTLSSLHLPIAASHESHDEETLAFVPANSNSLCTCSFLVDLLESLQYVSVNLSELLGSMNPFSLSLRSARVKIVKAACARWVQDSRSLRLHENWNESSLPELRLMSDHFASYHLWILRKLQCMLDPSGIDSAELKDIIGESLGAALNQSLQNFRDNKPSGLGYDFLSPPQLSPEDQILITLKSLSALQQTGLEHIFAEYRKCFVIKETLTLERASGRQVEEMQTKLFDLYIWEHKTMIDKIVSAGVTNDVETITGKEKPQAISGYAHECMMILSAVHSKVSEFVPRLLQSAIEKLAEHLLKAVRTEIRAIDRFQVGFCLQQAANTDFLRRVLKRYMTPAAKDVVRGIYECLKDNTVESNIRNQADISDSVADIVVAAVSTNQLIYEGFRTPVDGAPEN